MEINVENIATETIKPSSPTPNHLRTLNLSVFDQFLPPVYTVASLFYAADQKQNLILKENTSQKLKTYLSETLTRFYPFAGKINGVSVDCNDEGAIFVDARVDCPLSDFLKSPDFESLQQFLPLDIVDNPWKASASWPLLLVKATYFRCGGLAIGVCLSHKLADAASLSTFIRTWAAMARGKSDVVANPEFTASKFYPPASDLGKHENENVRLDTKISVTKRFVFDTSKITELKTKFTSANLLEPTRVETITAFLWKCAAAATSKSAKVLIQPVNLRPKISSVLSGNVVGNITYSTVALKIDGQGEVEIQDAINGLRKNAVELKNVIQTDNGESSMIGEKIWGVMLCNISKSSHENREPYIVSSWCKLQFYEADFGWGSPAWVAGNVAPASGNVMVLNDANDGKGIEAWVTLHEENMSSFEQNLEEQLITKMNLESPKS